MSSSFDGVFNKKLANCSRQKLHHCSYGQYYTYTRSTAYYVITQMASYTPSFCSAASTPPSPLNMYSLELRLMVFNKKLASKAVLHLVCLNQRGANLVKNAPLFLWPILYTHTLYSILYSVKMPSVRWPHTPCPPSFCSSPAAYCSPLRPRTSLPPPPALPPVL